MGRILLHLGIAILCGGMIFFTSCRTHRSVIKPSKPSTPTTVQDPWGGLKVEKGDNRKLYREIDAWLGTPYQYAGHSRQQGTDCSGFVMEIYKAVFHMDIERNSKRIFEKNCSMIHKDELREGDLVFFNTGGSGGGINHVGIYLKEGKFVHASSSKGVIVGDMNHKYFLKHFIVAGRVQP